MAAEAVSIILAPRVPRQLGENGLVVFWRDGPDPGRRVGLACLLSMCPHSDCACQDVHVDGFVIDDAASSVSWAEDGVRVSSPSGTVVLDEKMVALVDPNSGETTAHPDLPDATDVTLVEWLGSEMDEELLEVLHRYRARAKGYPPEQPKRDIDVDALEEQHLVAFDDMVEGSRSDDYLLGGHRYWTCILLCPDADCGCRQLRVVFFDDEAEPESGNAVGSVLLYLAGTEAARIVKMEAECGAPERLIQDLWALFERRHRVAEHLRRREAQAKAVGATIWRPVAKPVRVAPKPRRNDPCACGSGVKFKKCCLGKETSS